MHHEQLGNARSRLVPLAKKRAELDLASYAAGKLDLGTALLSTLAQVEAGVDALARDTEVARDAIRVNYIYSTEVHTSELQSLMHISSAAFCLKNTLRSTSPKTAAHPIP